MRYIREGHNDIVKVVNTLHLGSSFPEFAVNLGNKRMPITSEEFLRNVDDLDIFSTTFSSSAFFEVYQHFSPDNVKSSLHSLGVEVNLSFRIEN